MEKEATIILLDDRIGSKHYAEYIKIPNMVTRLDFADAAFSSVDGKSIGIEVKKILDAVSCMHTGRLVDHQVPGLRESYDVVYLIVEGIWRPEPESGVLQYYRGELGKWGSWVDAVSGRQRLMYLSFEQWLNTLALQGGFLVRSSPSVETTAALFMSLYAWFQREEHKSFQTMYENTGDAAVLSRPTMLRRMANLLPGIGWTRSKAVADYFGSVSRMVNADEADWLQVEGIGKVTAKKVVETIR